MSYAEILVPLNGDDEDEARLARADALARATGARAVAVLAQPDPAEAMMWSAEGVFAAMPSVLLESALKGAERAWAQAEALAAGWVAMGVEKLPGAPETVLPDRAALSDLVMFGCACARGRSLLSLAFETLLMDTRAPVLVSRGGAPVAGSPVVIAWDGSQQAGRAVRAATPLLKLAPEVVVAQSPVPLEAQGRRFSEPQRLLDRLSALGMSARFEPLDAGESTALGLLRVARAAGAGLLVSGAYGHSRAREFVFGGVTRHFLTHADTPSLLLSH